MPEYKSNSAFNLMLSIIFIIYIVTKYLLLFIGNNIQKFSLRSIKEKYTDNILTSNTR